MITTRLGISYTMTLAVIGTILMISGVIVAVAFSDQIGTITDILGGQQQQSDVEFCEQRITDFCRDQSAGTDWTSRFPDCAEEYQNRIDADGECPVGE